MAIHTKLEERLINEAYDDMLKSSVHQLTDENLALIKKAFDFANSAHAGVRRKSGEPYILHPLSVATIVTREIGLGTKAIISSILHDVVEDTDYTLEDIESMFGTKIASIVDGLTKLEGEFDFKQAANFRKMLLTLSDDVRVILIKIADRLHNMRTLDSMTPNKQLKISGETLYIYAPLAHRLGLYGIKTELEDLSLKYKYPDQYNEIALQLRDKEEHRKYLVEQFITPIKAKLEKENLDVNIKGRHKSIYSIWKKMQVKKVSFDEVYDLLAIRIVFKTNEKIDERRKCWEIFSIITSIYNYKQDRIRDWVTMPKANGYEALHVTVMGPEGKWVEVQIRSERMDEIAERGFAAHWKYKESGAANENELDKWIERIKETLQNPESDALEFLDDFKLNLFSSEIVVFTPKGDMKTLPKKSTVLDFAYEIHTDLGNKCIGAKINHQLVPISHVLKSGDQIEILTSEKQKPQAHWFKIAYSAKAKQKIKDMFKLEHKKHISKGKKLIEEELKKISRHPSNETINLLLEHFNLESKMQMYAQIGLGLINLREIDEIFKPKKGENKLVKYWRLSLGRKKKPQLNDESQTKIDRKKPFILSEENIEKKFHLAKCCNPIPGDDVIGYLNDNNKITIHKKSCPETVNLLTSEGDRIVTAKWKQFKMLSYLTHITIKGFDRIGIVSEITDIISKENNINMQTVRFDTHDGVFTGNLDLYVHNTKDVENIISQLQKVKGIESVERIEDV
ncbi:MAG: RelA/SpoT family protein [Prolixibacteraceae bacterium]|jgi:guanosine-3',5'-bis(diphosphate) 3'-pyrophosphohydrolase|nr:RelA/SpoT family protein [Prolixibacteraceae bacterium]